MQETHHRSQRQQPLKLPPSRFLQEFDGQGVVLSAFITVGLGVFAGLLVHRLTSSPAFGTVADVLFGVTGAFAARILTDLVLQTHSLSVAAVPVVLGSAAALPAWIHVEMERRKEDASARRIATFQSRTHGSQD